MRDIFSIGRTKFWPIGLRGMERIFLYNSATENIEQEFANERS